MDTSPVHKTDTTLPTNLETSQPSLISSEPSTTVDFQTQTSGPAASTAADHTHSSLTASTTRLTQSTATSDQTSATTKPQCTEEDCQCAAGRKCTFSEELGRCHCVCSNSTYGDTCSYGQNYTSPDIDTGAIPTRKANITLDIKITFLDDYYDLVSPQSLDFIRKLIKELEVLCKEADPQGFEKVEVLELLPGSIIAARRARGLYQNIALQLVNTFIKTNKAGKEVITLSLHGVAATSRAAYSYQNNQTQIQWLNIHLNGTLTQILDENIAQISQAFGGASVQLEQVVSGPPEINNITDMQPFVSCSAFANYSAEVVEGQWQCVGPCKTSTDYCSSHGECLNDIHRGPLCRCYESNIRQYYGQQCQLVRWGPGFYGAVFGSLAGALLLVLIVLLAVFLVKRKHSSPWYRSHFTGYLDFEEDYFDFTDTGTPPLTRHDGPFQTTTLGLEGTYRDETFRPHLENIDPHIQVSTKRPEVLHVTYS
uniref:mucin-3B n=1 Tax=Doryrhamphus excisus TaxID=161450 RepID=UPI0025ADEB35|nr:mucin-3B [Doryrhamphus excisus]